GEVRAIGVDQVVKVPLIRHIDSKQIGPIGIKQAARVIAVERGEAGILHRIGYDNPTIAVRQIANLIGGRRWSKDRVFAWRYVVKNGGLVPQRHEIIEHSRDTLDELPWLPTGRRRQT